MNIFRFFGDMSHLASILVLLLKLRASKSAAGVMINSAHRDGVHWTCRVGFGSGRQRERCGRVKPLFRLFLPAANRSVGVAAAATASVEMGYVRVREMAYVHTCPSHGCTY